MKPGRAVLLSLATTSACIISYEFLDQPIARFCSTIDGTIRCISELITRLGISTPYLVAAFAGFIYLRFVRKNKILANAAAFLFFAVALAGIANDLIKILVGRSRPGLLLSHGVYGFKPFTNQYYYASFPSGHANTIAALCYGVGVVMGRFKYILMTIALAVMASRVIVGAHFPSDVLFGAYLGVVVTELIAAGFEKKGLLITRQPEKAPPQPVEKTNAV
ncbi:Phosphoesterase, PA-phosphatase related [Syntrophobacter sp. SbD2]|nr:Phosphoesterase, PA-phosphatase related [Syntrophobacter sp. SbD2]